MKLARLLALALAGTALLWAAPAGAIETPAFGIDVVERSDDARLHIGMRAGEATTGELRVWNKQDRPIDLKLSVAAATVAKDGSAALGGDDEPVGWVRLEPSVVHLEPGASRTVTVEVRAPRRIDAGHRSVAVVAEPIAEEGAAPAVLQRLAVTTFLEPDDGSLVASLGRLPWLAAGVLVVVAVAAARAARRSRAGVPIPRPAG